MRSIDVKSTIYRVCYLLLMLCALAFSVYLLVMRVLDVREGLTFSLGINLVALGGLLVFQGGIVAVLVRYLRVKQSILLKSIIFKKDGAPHVGTLVSTAVCGLASLVVGILLFCGVLMPASPIPNRLFVGNALLTLSINCIMVDGFYLLYRHYAGMLAVI